MVKIAHKIERTHSAACFRLSFDKCATKDVDHDALWRLFVTGKHTARLRMRERAVVFRDVVDSKAATGEKESVRDVNKKRCYIVLDFDTEHTSTAETGNSRPASSQTETTSLLAPNVSIAQISCSNHLSW